MSLLKEQMHKEMEDILVKQYKLLLWYNFSKLFIEFHLIAFAFIWN